MYTQGLKILYKNRRIFENMGFGMKYDLTYIHFLEKKVLVWLFNVWAEPHVTENWSKKLER